MARPLHVLTLVLGGGLLVVGPMAAAQQEVPPWAQAGLTEEDVGPGFERTRSELVTLDGLGSHLVLFERRSPGSGNELLAIGSLLIRSDGGAAQPSLDELASAVVRSRAGLQPIAGPAFGDDVRWYAGPWSEGELVDEAYVLVAHLGETVVSVAVVGAPGRVRPEDVLAYAGLVAARLARAPTATTLPPTPTAEQPTATPQSTPTGGDLPFPPTATQRAAPAATSGVSVGATPTVRQP